MLGIKIQNLLSPSINFYESNEPNYFSDIYQITEENSNFEKIINELKANSKKKFSLKACSNPNCDEPFSRSSNCKECTSCGAKYCPKCIKNCKNCDNNVCIFCITMKYDKFEDLELCPNCANN